MPFQVQDVSYHVHGHLNRYYTRDKMSQAEILNCDQLAGSALLWAVENSCYINRFLSEEDIIVSVNGCMITGSYKCAITRHWGDKVGREHYYVKDIISPG